MKRLLAAAALTLGLYGIAQAAIDTYEFANDAQRERFVQLTKELRCPKCQNNSIADSNAMIAHDMRQKVYELMQQGKSREEIVDYMVDRYGNFVTYEPPVTPSTIILWLVPALFILGGGIVIWRSSRRSNAAAGLDANEQQRLQALLDEDKRTPR